MFIVVGGGIAGVSCAEQLALLCPEQAITLVSASPLVKACINIKQIAKVLEEFEVEERAATYLESQYPNIKVVISPVQGLDTVRKELTLSNGSTLSFEKLCLCTGGKPKLLAENNPFVIGIRDTQTVQVLQEKLINARKVVVVGNGGIATELVYELESCHVVWVIRDPSIGATFFDAGAAEFFLPHLSAPKENTSKPLKRTKYQLTDSVDIEKCPKIKGSALGPDWNSNLELCGTEKNAKVHIEYECEVSNIYYAEEAKKKGFSMVQLEEETSSGDWPIFVELTNGKFYGCDFVVSATGVVPNTDAIFKNNQLEVAEDGGLLVDTQMQTSEPDIYASGDVCTTAWPPSKNWLQMRLWTQARQMGLYAAHCMYLNSKGEKNDLDICFDLFTHVTRFFGYKVVLLGVFNCQRLEKDYNLLLRMTRGQEYIKVVLQNGRVQGAILIGDTDLEETFENLILNQLDVSYLGEDLLNPNVDIEDYFD